MECPKCKTNSAKLTDRLVSMPNGERMAIRECPESCGFMWVPFLDQIFQVMISTPEGIQPYSLEYRGDL